MYKLRDVIAFWILGLCNNYGYVVMLSAAHDILARNYEPESDITDTTDPSRRDCNTVSTGAILLADIVPSLITKIVAPFFPLAIHVRMAIVVLLGAAGYILVAAATASWMAIMGVICTAFASGLGEASLLSYMAFYKDKNVISTWSSGTGGAGVFGAITYAGFTSLGMSPSTTLYTLLIVPLLMAINFWFVLQHPKLNDTADSETRSVNHPDNENEVPVATTQDSFGTKLSYIPNLLPYMIPLGLVYFFEYFINQGLFELIQYDGIWLTHKEQYRWYQVDYQIGVFISRSSIMLIQINKTWILALLQGLNVVLFTLESVYFFLPSVYLILLAVLWEGLLGGAAYVNTYYRIAAEVPPEKREFSMAITSLADSIGITLAGFLSMPIHNYICDLPKSV
uniref:Battenin n=1 Tax=Clastoptera arizonana TaxID=38151 RepID=A0A1B6DN77_9HEMI